MKIDPQLSFGKTVVAVEPGPEWFKLVEVARDKAGPKLGKVVLKRSAEVEPLAGPDFLKAVGVPELAGSTVILVLPRPMVNVRLFDLPSGDPQEIADMVDLQIARQTPYSRDEIVFDYRAFRSDKEGYTRVMLVIVQTGVVRQRCAMLEASGLSAGLVTVTTEGWLAGLESGQIAISQGLQGVLAFLDGDSHAGDFMVLNRGVPMASRTLASLATPDIAQALETVRNETPGLAVSSLVLAGGLARQESLPASLKSALALEAVATRGVERLADDQPMVSANKGVSLAGVLGAAAAPDRLQINLMPESIQLRKSVMTRARQLTGTGILVLAIAALLSLLVMTRIQREEAYLHQLQGMIRETTPAVETLDAMRRKMTVVAGRMESRLLPAAALVELYKVADESMAFTSIEITDAAQMVCRGSVETVADAMKLVNAMEASRLFKNVKSARTVSGKDRTEFEISCELEKRRP